MADRIQQRRDTRARWEEFNPLLLEGEVGYVTDDPNLYKIGDGINRWNSLPYRGFDGTITQETGNSENAVISQKAVSKKLSELGQNQSEIRLVGEGSELVTTYIRLIPNSIYRLYFITRNWDSDEIGTGSSKVTVAYSDEDGNTQRLYQVIDKDESLVEYIDIEAKKTSTGRYAISIRANEGVEIFMRLDRLAYNESSVVNLSPEGQVFKNDNAAINAVPICARKIGLLVTYISEIEGFKTLQFEGDEISEFTQANKWATRSIYATDGFRYAGIATPDSAPTITRSKVCYLALENGIYTAFGGIEVDNEIAIIKYTPKGNLWEKDSITSYKYEITERINIPVGVVSTNSNVWAMQDEVRNENPYQYYWSGFTMNNFISVTQGDTLNIDYDLMGVDRSIYKIGVVFFDNKYKAMYQNTFNGYVRWVEENMEIIVNKAFYIKITVLQKDISVVRDLKDMLPINVVFTKYNSKELCLIKDADSTSSSVVEYPFVKPITYAIKDAVSQFNGIIAESDTISLSIGYNNGVVIFPKEYSPTGEKLPLIIYVHGTGGFEFNNPQNSSANYLPFLKDMSKGGYVVTMCSTLSSLYYNNDMGVKMNVRDANYPEPIAWECYHKLYQYLTDRFNIDKNRVYVFGKSAGGMNVIMLSKFGVIPIRAAAGLAASTDLITNMRVVGLASISTNPFLHRIGLSDANVGDKLNGSGDLEYLVMNKDKLIGYNPFWHGTVGLDREIQVNRCIVDNMSSSAIENDKELQDTIDKATTIINTPMKWWHALDDINVPIATTRMYQKMVKNGGGLFYIREFPEGCGAHHAVDNAENAPTTEYVHKNGEIVTLPTAYAEVLDWFNLW